MYMNVIDLSKSVSFVLEDIDIGGQIQYITCTGPYELNNISSRTDEKHVSYKKHPLGYKGPVHVRY